MARNTALNREIPPGKKVKIFTCALNDEREDPIETLMLKDSFTIPIAAEYTSISNSASFVQSVGSQLLGKALDALTNSEGLSNTISSIVGGLNTRLGFQTYSSPKPVTISLNCSIMAITNAWTDVVNPIRRIQSLLLPTEGKGGFLTDYPGVDPLIALTGGYGKTGKAYKDASVMIGNIGFNHVIFKNVDATFSSEVDETGYPIQADVSLTFDTSFFATKNMLNDEIYGCTENGELIRGGASLNTSPTLEDLGLENPWA